MSIALNIHGLSVGYPGGPDVVKAVDLQVNAGERLVLLGPSGAGKTTLLRAIAGFERPRTGQIRIDGRDVAHTPTERRGVGYVFQTYALFPHMSLARNIAFGLAKTPPAERDARTREMLALVGLSDFADRLPAELSGGQQQRVALARAIAPRPPILLLDEPFSNLDAALRDRLRGQVLARLSVERTAVLMVTHDQSEALQTADRLAVMHGGALLRVDSAEVIYRDPTTAFVADFLGGTNVLEGLGDGACVQTALGALPIEASGQISVSVRPHDVEVVVDPAGNATVEARIYGGHEALLDLQLGTAIIRARVGPNQSVQVGDRVAVSARRGTILQA